MRYIVIKLRENRQRRLRERIVRDLLNNNKFDPYYRHTEERANQIVTYINNGVYW